MTLVDKIKLLFKIKTPVQNFIGEVQKIKSGWHELSFWIGLVTTLSTIAVAVAGFIPVKIGVIITTVIVVIYNILRAIQNAGTPGVQPLLLSTRFWMGVLGILAAGIASLQQGGIDSQWLVTASAIIGAIMAAAQSMGAIQPQVENPLVETPPDNK